MPKEDKKKHFVFLRNAPDAIVWGYALTSDNEGLSLAFLEAMASGLVCVTIRCTGNDGSHSGWDQWLLG